jgi:THUMP domain-like
MTDVHGFIWEHRDESPATLALSAKKYPDLPMSHIARQVDALQKIQRKIPSWYQPGLHFPVAISLEQASSEATARFKATLCAGSRGADLTGGLGVDAYFMSQQFGSYDFVEISPEISTAAAHNLAVLKAQNITFHHQTAADFLAQQPALFDWIYLDPARRNDQKGKVFQLADCSPDVLALKNTLFTKSRSVLLKTAPLLDIRLAMTQLQQVSAVWVVEYESECREVLYRLEPIPCALETVPIKAVVLNHSGAVMLSFQTTFAAEKAAEIQFSQPLKFLYEPYPSVLKTGAFKSFAQQFNLYKLQINTHLYTSSALVTNLPARVFEVLQVCAYDVAAIQKVVPGGKAHITTRNFPENADQVRKKLRLKDGGDLYLFATTDMSGKKAILVCQKA